MSKDANVAAHKPLSANLDVGDLDAAMRSSGRGAVHRPGLSRASAKAGPRSGSAKLDDRLGS